jgi:hypothetical protein
MSCTFDMLGEAVVWLLRKVYASKSDRLLCWTYRGTPDKDYTGTAAATSAAVLCSR